MWNFRKYKNKTALITENNEYKFNDIKKFSEKLKKKIKKKNLILILCENSIECILGYLGFFINNQTILFVDLNTEKNLLGKIIKKYSPDFIWAPKTKKKNFNKKYTSHFDYLSYCLFKIKKKNHILINDNLCLLVPTSGSMGSPKLVKQTYKNIKENTNSILKYLKIKESDKTIMNLPLSYTYGISIINTHLKVGSPIVITKYTILQKKFWKLFELNKISVLNGVPYTYEILDKLNFFKNYKKNLKIITQAGGKLPDNLQKKINSYCLKYNTKFYIMYGQSEATTRISFLPFRKNKVKIGSIGKPIHKGKIFLKDRLGNIINKPNLIGKIFYTGPNVCSGYSYNRADLNKEDKWKGIIDTGDLGKKDSEGYYYITGREKRISKIYGHSLNLDEIELMIKNYLNENDIAVRGNDKFIYIYYSKKKIINKLKKFIFKKIKINSIVFNFKYLKKIPKLVSGKINYKKLYINN